MTRYDDLAGPDSNPHLVDGRLGDVGALLGLVQLVLDLPEAHRIAARLLLLVDAQSNDNSKSTCRHVERPQPVWTLVVIFWKVAHKYR